MFQDIEPGGCRFYVGSWPGTVHLVMSLLISTLPELVPFCNACGLARLEGGVILDTSMYYHYLTSSFPSYYLSETTDATGCR